MSRSPNRSLITNSAGIFNFAPGHGFELQPRLSYRVKGGRGTGSECPLWVISGHVRRKNIMSALPPIATAKADIGKRSCLLCPRKRTSGGNRINQCGIVAWRARRVAMCARCAAATSTAQERQVSLAPTQARSARDIPSRSLSDTQAHRKDHPASASPRRRRQQDYLAAYTRRSPSRSSRAPTLKRIILVYPVGDKLTRFLLFISLPHRRPMSAVSPIATKF